MKKAFGLVLAMVLMAGAALAADANEIFNPAAGSTEAPNIGAVLAKVNV